MRAFVPPQGFNDRADATYFPIPWVLSTRGYGVLVGGNATSRFELGSPWSADVDGAHLQYSVYAGPRPADVLRRFTRRRRAPAAARRAVLLRPVVAARRRRRPEHRPAQGRGRAGLADADLHALPALRRPAGRGPPSSSAMTAQFHDAGLRGHHLLQPDDLHELPAAPTTRPRPAAFLNTNAAGQPYVYPYTGSRAVPGRPVRLHRARARCVLRRPARARRSATATTAGWRTSASTRRPTRSRPTARPARRCTTATRRSTTAPPTTYAQPRAAAAGALQPLGLDRRGARVADRLGRRPDDRAGASTA